MSVAYFDNAATTFVKPQEVHDFMYEFYCANSVNVGRGNHLLLQKSNEIVSQTRKKMLELFRANNLYETIFTPTATEAINVILQGQDWMKNDIVYISPFEHNAVYRTIKHLESIYHLQVEILKINQDTYQLDMDAIALQFAMNKPKMVIATHVSNVNGNILDIHTLGRLAKKNDARIMFDCAQSAGLLDIDIVNSCADYIIFAGHKTLYGPFGCSGFISKKESAVKPLIYGGTGVDSANIEMPKDLPTRYEAGSMNIMAISGLYKALEWREKIGTSEIQRKEKENFEKLSRILNQYDFVEIVGETKNSTSIISCRFKGYSPDNIGNIMSQYGVVVRTGLQCAPLSHKTMGTFPEGTVRFSISYFTTDEDFKKLQEVMEIISEG